MSNQATIQLVVILVTNCISVVATLSVIISYVFFRSYYPVAMSRSTLFLSACMAAADFLEHSFNLAGYSATLPDSACGVIGGFFFAVPLLCSVMYACSVALNCLLVFVLRQQQVKWMKYVYIWGPPVASSLIGIGTLASGSYGFDDKYGYCWYKTDGVSDKLLFVRELLTWSLPLFICFTFLVVSIGVIIHALLKPSFYSTPTNTRSLSNFSGISSAPRDAGANNLTLRQQARRALLFRLIAYIVIPFVTILPLIIVDYYSDSHDSTPFAADLVTSALGSMLGTCNAIVYFADPTILAVLGVARRVGLKKKGLGNANITGGGILGGPAHASTNASYEDHALGDIENSKGEVDASHLAPQISRFGKTKRLAPPSPGLLIFVQVTQESDAVELAARDIQDL